MSAGAHFLGSGSVSAASPQVWATAAVEAFHRHRADRLVAEVNQGGDLVEANLRNVRRDLPIYTVHAKHAKRVRAEPVAALYEQGRVHHVGSLATLEDQYVTWEPDVVEGGKHVKTDSPDRLDAAVYAITDLMIDRNPDAGTAHGGFVLGTSFEDRPVGDYHDPPGRRPRGHDPKELHRDASPT